MSYEKIHPAYKIMNREMHWLSNFLKRQKLQHINGADIVKYLLIDGASLVV